MGKVEHIRNDGSVLGIITELNALYHTGEIEKIIVGFIRPDGTPAFCFAGTDTIFEELGLLELGKIQALKTREIISD